MTNKKNIKVTVGCGLLSILLFSCNYKNQSNSVNNPSTFSVNKTLGETSSQELSNQKPLDNKAKFGDYNYSYKKEGEKTVALFAEKFLPRDDKIVVEAIRDIIKKSYNENATGIPSLKQHSGFSKIHISSNKSDFYVNLIKEDTGEVHSLVIDKESQK